MKDILKQKMIQKYILTTDIPKWIITQAVEDVVEGNVFNEEHEYINQELAIHWTMNDLEMDILVTLRDMIELYVNESGCC